MLFEFTFPLRSLKINMEINRGFPQQGIKSHLSTYQSKFNYKLRKKNRNGRGHIQPPLEIIHLIINYIT